jgi:hypothetical protein
MKIPAGVALGAIAFALLPVTPAAARANPLRPPDYCQVFDDIGSVQTIGWGEEGCHSGRDAFALRIVDHRNRPGYYPPLTCSVGAVIYDWPAPACAHARNLYARGKIHPIYYGKRPARRS